MKQHRFVVCTHSYLLLVTVGEDLRDAHVDVLDKGYFDGADVTIDGELIVAARKTEPWRAKTPCVLQWYDDMGPNGMPDIDGSDILDPHQISLGPNDRTLWATSTADNAIIGIPLTDTDSYRKFRINFGGDEGDWNHINSIYMYDKTTLYTVMHNLGMQPSFIIKHEMVGNAIPIQERHFTPFKGIHNVIVKDDGTLYYNASEDGCVVRDLWDDSVATIEHKEPGSVEQADIGDDWHPKGMCETDEYIVVGYSEHAVETPRRYISQSGLAFIDKHTWEVVATPRLSIPGNRFGLGNINEVRLYGVPRA